MRLAIDPAVVMADLSASELGRHLRHCWLRADAPGCDAVAWGLAEADGAGGDPAAASGVRTDARRRAQIRGWLEEAIGPGTGPAAVHPGWRLHLPGVDRVEVSDGGGDPGASVCAPLPMPHESRLAPPDSIGRPVVTLPVWGPGWPAVLDPVGLLALCPSTRSLRSLAPSTRGLRPLAQGEEDEGRGAERARGWWSYGVPVSRLFLSGEPRWLGAAPAEGPVRLHGSPLGWLRAGGLVTPEGLPPNLCVLDWADPWTLDAVRALPGPIVCDDREQAAAVHRATRKRAKLPEIHVMKVVA